MLEGKNNIILNTAFAFFEARATRSTKIVPACPLVAKGLLYDIGNHQYVNKKSTQREPTPPMLSLSQSWNNKHFQKC
jgi:hypothetical protein